LAHRNPFGLFPVFPSRMGRIGYMDRTVHRPHGDRFGSAAGMARKKIFVTRVHPASTVRPSSDAVSTAVPRSRKHRTPLPGRSASCSLSSAPGVGCLYGSAEIAAVPSQSASLSTRPIEPAPFVWHSRACSARLGEDPETAHRLQPVGRIRPHRIQYPGI